MGLKTFVTVAGTYKGQPVQIRYKGQRLQIRRKTHQVEDKKIRFANPQFFSYFFIMYCITVLMILPLMVAPYVQKFNSFFVKMTCASVSIAVLASCILTFAGFYLQTLIKDIHYTILRSIGCFSAMLALFSLWFSVFQNHVNWIVLSVMCVIFAGIYHVIWKFVCTRQQPHQIVHLNVHWSETLMILLPLSNVLPPNLPPWPETQFMCECFHVIAIAIYIYACTRFICRYFKS